MKLKSTTRTRRWRIPGTALAAVLLMAGAGCIHVAINVGAPPNQRTGDPNKSGGNATRIITEDPPGGNFTPVHAPRSASITGTTICGQQVSKYYVRFSNPYLWQTSPPTATAFQGRVFNTNTATMIPNTNYVLQWFIDSSNKQCATNVTGSTTEIGFVVQPGAIYRFTAYFKNNLQPPSGHQIELQGNWIEP